MWLFLCGVATYRNKIGCNYFIIKVSIWIYFENIVNIVYIVSGYVIKFDQSELMMSTLIEIKWVTFLECANLLIHVWLLLYSIQTTVLKVFIAPISPVFILLFYRVQFFSFRLLCYSMNETFPLISMCSNSYNSVLTNSTHIIMCVNNVLNYFYGRTFKY